MKLELFGGRLTAKRAINIGRFIKKKGNDYAELTTKQHINARLIHNKKKTTNRVSIVTDIFDILVKDCLLPSFFLAKKIKHITSSFDKKLSIAISGNTINRCNLFKYEICFALAQKNNLFGYNLYLFGRGGKNAKPCNIFLKNDDEVLKIIESIMQLMNTYQIKRFYKLEEKFGLSSVLNMIKNFSKTAYQDFGKTMIQQEYEKQKTTIKLKNNLFAVKVIFPNGVISGTKLIELALKSEKFANCNMVIDKEQNLYILGVKKEFLQEFEFNLSPYYHHQVACAGEKFCQYGLIDSKQLAISLTKYLEKNIPAINLDISFYWSGCNKGCAGHLLSDIGFQGCQQKQKAGVKIFIFGKEICSFVELEKINQYVEKLIRQNIQLFKRRNFNE